MSPYIYGIRNQIHIIDLKLTVRGILRARHFLREVIAGGQDVLFVGTKRQIQAEIRKVHEETKMPYVDDRWIGGMLTNYEVIGSRLAYLEDLEKKEAEGYLDQITSKEAARFMREKRKVYRNLHGIRDMFRLPGAMVVVDPRTEVHAVREARRMGIPVIGIVDTDGDPDVCDVVIPANDDAIRSVSLILEKLIKAVKQGLDLRAERGIPQATRETVDVATGVIPVPKPRVGRPRPDPAALRRSVEITALGDENVGEKTQPAATEATIAPTVPVSTEEPPVPEPAAPAEVPTAEPESAPAEEPAVETPPTDEAEKPADESEDS